MACLEVLLPERQIRCALGLTRLRLQGLAVTLFLGVCLGFVNPGTTQAQQRTVFPSADGPGAEPVMLRALLLRGTAVVGGAMPAVVLLPDCQGAWRDEAAEGLEGQVQDLATALNEAGLHVLVLDSLRPRGLREICSDKIATRQLRPGQLRRDALAALDFLGQQAGVDAQRLGLVGIGRGAVTALAAINRQHADVRRAARMAVAVVSIRPACTAEQRAGYEAGAAMKVLLSDADDAESNAQCRELVQQVAASGTAAARVLVLRGPRVEPAVVSFLRELLKGSGSVGPPSNGAGTSMPTGAHGGPPGGGQGPAPVTSPRGASGH